MSETADDALILLEILELLGAFRACVSYADVCVYLSGRYELQPLLELRSLLYSTACRDPCFPATLFRERLHPPCSNCLSAAADVVSLFNLLTHTRLPPTHTHTDNPLTSCVACGLQCAHCDWLQERGGAIATGCKYEDSTEKLISHSTEVNTPSCSHSYTHSDSHTPSQPRMQKAHSLDVPNGSTGYQESASKVTVVIQDMDPGHSCTQKRRVFKGEFHNLLPYVPMESNGKSEQSPGGVSEQGEEVHFHSCKNPYPESATDINGSNALTHTHHPSAHMHDTHSDNDMNMNTPVSDNYTDAQASFPEKHKSLDDLQSSTYFGPTVIERTNISPALMGKSYSLDIDSMPVDASEHDKFGLERKKPQRPRSEKSALDKTGLIKPDFSKLSFEGSSFDIPGFDPFIVRSVQDTLKRLSGLNLDAWYDWSPDTEGLVSVGTQTDMGDRRALRSLLLSDKLSMDNTDIGEDDISAIFRFLDDISMCGSMAVLPGAGGGPQDGVAAGLPERRERLGKLRRLFHSLEGPEEGVRWGVGRLLQRVTELEQRLEPISELKEQLALVLSTLNRLEQRGQLFYAHSEPLPTQQKPLTKSGDQQEGNLRSNSGLEETEGFEAAAQGRGLFTRNPRNHTGSSSSEHHREWSVSYSKDHHTLHPAQADQQGELVKKDPIQERKSSVLILEAQSAPLRSSMQKANMNKNDRPKVSWSQTDFASLSLQPHESMDFWMDEVYTPVTDTLLHRSQSLTRCTRSQSYRVTAISITATVILILIIVIPICTV